jgi:CheY-like chemotaxis protein
MSDASPGNRDEVPLASYAGEVRLVLADNDANALDLIELDLRLEGHEIVGLARDGLEAIEVCATQRPDILVVDYRMPPGIDGVDVAEQVLRATSAGRVIVYSNYNDPEVVARARAAGATWVSKGRLAVLRAAIA